MAKALLSVAAAAETLGLQPSTIRAWVLRRRVPVVHVGRAVRIPAAWIDDFIRKNTTPAREGRQ